jgi:hypothetical protein
MDLVKFMPTKKKAIILQKTEKVVKVKKKRKRKVPQIPIDEGIILSIDEIYKIINEVQVAKIEKSFIIKDIDFHMVNNILKDINISSSYHPIFHNKYKECKIVKILPNLQEEKIKDFEKLEEFSDETYDND